VLGHQVDDGLVQIEIDTLERRRHSASKQYDRHRDRQANQQFASWFRASVIGEARNSASDAAVDVVGKLEFPKDCEPCDGLSP
jgi:hypothetical protein